MQYELSFSKLTSYKPLCLTCFLLALLVYEYGKNIQMSVSIQTWHIIHKISYIFN